MGNTKPPYCPDLDCECIWSNIAAAEPWHPGRSIDCYGRMKKPRTFIIDGIQHDNDLYWCCWTPLKGWLRFEVNAGDLSLTARACIQVLEKIGKPLNPNWAFGKKLVGVTPDGD